MISRLFRITPIFCLVIFLTGIYHARSITFRVEHWDYLYYFLMHPFDLSDLKVWRHIAFWSPFQDFRMLPLAYLWHFFTIKAFGTNNQLYLILNIAIHIVNCVLAGRYVALLCRSTNIRMSMITVSLLLLFPAKVETLIWTFFSYKLFHATLILASLILLERYFLSRRLKHAFFSVLLLFVSWFFYEAGIPLILLYVLRLAMCADKRIARDVIVGLIAMGAILLSYAFLYGTAAEWFRLEVSDTGYAHIGRSLTLKHIESFLRWLAHGVIAANSGIPLIFYPMKRYLIFLFGKSLFWPACVLIPWISLFACLRLNLKTLKDAFYVALLFAASAGPVVFVRTITDGPIYLSVMSIYQYLPSVFLSIIIGLVVEKTLLRKSAGDKRAVIIYLSLTVIYILLGIAHVRSIANYLPFNKPTQEYISGIGKMIEKDASVRIDPQNIEIPYAFDALGTRYFKVSHPYRILKVLYGENIVRGLNKKQTE